MEQTIRDFTSKEYVIPEGTIPERRNGVAIAAGLEKYSGEWNKETAAHLLRRATFGPSKSAITEFEQMTLDECVDKILTFDDPFELPLNYRDDKDPYAKIGETWVGTPYSPNSFGQRLESFLARWFGNIVSSGDNVGEKMTLFWHNHFVTQAITVREENFTFNYYKKLRDNCLGNFETLTEKITIDAAMLRYLNGEENLVGRPNENYARELLELFTIGKGPLIGPGNYTNYTEDDVVEAAKVLTGWRIIRDTGDSKYYNALHDKTTKTFSSAFGNKSITNGGEEEYKKLIAMILDQEETARHICRKIYRWFVYYEIDEETENNTIKPMADIFRVNNYEIKPVLKALFSSAHFYDKWNVGCVIKSPLDFVTAMYRALEIEFPSRFDEKYSAWLAMGTNYIAVQEMILGEPPSVAGWPAMYQAPGYHRFWLTSVSAPYRALLADIIATVPEIKGRGYTVTVDILGFAEKMSNPVDPNDLIDEISDYLIPVKLTDNQKAYLKSNLLPDGLEDYQWSAVWAGYVADPENTENTRNVETLLRLLIRATLNIAEYQLS